MLPTPLTNTSLYKYFSNRLPRFQFFYRTPRLYHSLLKLQSKDALTRSTRTQEFEAAICKHFNSRHCLTTSSFRMGLYFTLKSLNLKEGDEILLSPITIPDTINAILLLKLKPVFVDMSLDDHCIDLAHAQKQLTPKTRVLLATYLSGIVPNIQKIKDFTQKHNLLFIEDFSQNYEAHFGDKYLGTWGDISIGSLSSGKILSSAVGGIILTQSDEYAANIKKEIESFIHAPTRSVLGYYLKNCIVVETATLRPIYIFFTHSYLRIMSILNGKGIVDFEHDPDHRNNIFFCSKPKLRTEFPKSFYTWLCNWQADMALGLLEDMKTNTNKRRHLAKTLFDHLNPEAKKFIPHNLFDYEQNSYYHFPINCFGKREEMRKKLFKNGIDNGSYGLNLCSEEAVFHPHTKSLENARIIKYDTVFIPLNEKYSENHMRHIAMTLNEMTH